METTTTPIEVIEAYVEPQPDGMITIEHIKNGVVTHIETSGMRGELAEQVSREKLRAKRSRPDGRTEYDWKTADPHDFGDCVTMCYAIAAASGIAAAGMGNSIPKKRKRYRYVNPS